MRTSRANTVALIIALAVNIAAVPVASPFAKEVVPLLNDTGAVSEKAMETLLAPGEFPGRVFSYVSRGDAAAYSLDASLGAADPFVELHPDRLPWPRIAGVDIVVENGPIRLAPADEEVTDALLDAGFEVRWRLVSLGQRFDPAPHFSIRIIAAEIVATRDDRSLLAWQAPPGPPVCRPAPGPEVPNCDLSGISREIRAMALSPDGSHLALAIGGIRPRIEVYDIRVEPRLAWQSLFPPNSGGVVEVAFSADGEWIVALTGNGRMHRYGATTGGRHLAIPSAGQTARTIPPGHIMAVGGDNGEVTLWYLADGTVFWRLPPRDVRGPVDRLAASGNGRRFATLEYDDAQTVVRIWEVKQRAMLTQFEVGPYEIVDIALDASGEHVYLTHEKKGLLSANVEKKALLAPVSSAEGKLCVGRLQWTLGLDLLSCATTMGVIQVDRNGNKKRTLNTGGDARRWTFAASRDGDRLAAVGDGHLLIWWGEKKSNPKKQQRDNR
ncbi:MAG: WD40 repeat domain-containing protein [Myxococcota bacterium]|nr:WD40 repeat domain-containing protein [Myxococcota bacterium]